MFLKQRETTPLSRLGRGKTAVSSPGNGARGRGLGRAQLTLVEHALCPLDPAVALAEGLTHRAEFSYLDEHRHQKKAMAQVLCPFGLAPGDEFYLWGLIALTLAQPEPGVEFYATPHYCLSELGLIPRAGGSGSKGGKNFVLFRQAMTRLAAVTYLNDEFYDPVRGERRRVAFGFLSYSLPADPSSSRAWRLVWDPLFFEFCQAARGSLLFDLDTYRGLDCASRRLFLLLQKIFWRLPQSPAFDVRHLAVNALGFAPSLDLRDLKVKVARSAERLAALGIIAAPEGEGSWFEKKGVGSYAARFRRGPYFDRDPVAPEEGEARRSPLFDPLRAIGFADAAIGRILRTYKHSMIQVWADITLAALEKGPGFFKVGAPAYFMDNIDKAAQGRRTPPDWWYEHRKEEERRERESKRAVLQLPDVAQAPRNEEQAFEDYLQGEGREAFAAVLERLTREQQGNGTPGRNATETARAYLKSRFRQERRAQDPDTVTPLGAILKNLKPECS